MTGNTALKLLFVINPKAGPDHIPWQEIIRNYFTGKDHIINYFLLDKNLGPEELNKQIEEGSPDRVIAVGGDGTVGFVAKQLGNSKIAMGILPAGSANGMAKELNISDDPEEALAIIESGEIKCCDAIKINDKDICLHLSDIGLNAQLIKYFNEGKLRGKLGYARVLLKTLWYREKRPVTIQTKNEEIRRNAFMVVLANASKYGTGAVINPLGQLDDGEFEVVIVRKLALSELLKMIFRWRRFDPKKIEIFPATSVKMQTLKKVHFQIDGEYMGKITSLNASILPGYINIILPKSKIEE